MTFQFIWHIPNWRSGGQRLFVNSIQVSYYLKVSNIVTSSRRVVFAQRPSADPFACATAKTNKKRPSVVAIQKPSDAPNNPHIMASSAHSQLWTSHRFTGLRLRNACWMSVPVRVVKPVVFGQHKIEWRHDYHEVRVNTWKKCFTSPC